MQDKTHLNVYEKSTDDSSQNAASFHDGDKPSETTFTVLYNFNFSTNIYNFANRVSSVDLYELTLVLKFSLVGD